LNKSQGYLAHTASCRSMAQRADRQDDKEFWLGLERAFLRVIADLAAQEEISAASEPGAQADPPRGVANGARSH
jgi:hypothetical protein